jgi:FAD/FMN-containing dehydrogenase
LQCREPPALREVQIPYFEVQIPDFSAVFTDVAMDPSSPSPRGGTMTAPTSERVSLPSDTVTALEIPGFRGALIAAEHADYDDARAVWNGTVDRRPRLIARCTGTADVAAAVRFARDRDLEIAVRGGGHNVAGTAVCDDGIVIDLSAMRAVAVNTDSRTAQVQGGALWGDVDHETQAHGLATTGGIVGHTGVGGLSLGGGIGWLMRKHGLTVDNLVEAEVVTAEGDIIRASADKHPDLFWALRGGGGNFGVVSSFRFALHPVGQTVTAGPVFWTAEDTTDVLRFYRDFVADAPDELGTVIRLGTIPPLPDISDEFHFRPAIAVACCYAGPVDDGERAVHELRQFGTPLVDRVGPTLYVDHQSSIDDTVPHGWHYYWKATNLTGLSDEVIDVVAEYAYRASSPRSYAAMFHMGGAVARAPRDATAYPDRDVAHNIIIDAAWLPDQDDTVGTSETAWARAFLHALQPHHAGVYVNFLDSDDDTSRVREAYGDDTYQRLAKIKAKYDPENVFHNNKNIPPREPGNSRHGERGSSGNQPSHLS